MVQIDASQIDRLSRDLGKAGAKVTAGAARIVIAGAHHIEAAAKRVAPVDTGMLRNSIGVTLGGAGAGIEATIGPTVHYAPHVEFGTVRQAPQPFMRPAADMVLPTVEAAFQDLLGDIL